MSSIEFLPTSLTAKFPNNDEFCVIYYKQCFSLPNKIIYYMAKNPCCEKIYEKLIQSCKYFFLKNPTLIYHCLFFVENEWKTCIDGKCLGPRGDRKYRKVRMDLNKLQSKIWATFGVKISSLNSNFFSSLFFNGKLRALTLHQQNIPFKDFLFISNQMVRILFNESYVFYPNGDEVPYENIFANLPMIKYFCFRLGNIAYNFSKTVTELLKIPHFRNLKSLDCIGISQPFDIDKFFQYLKQNKFTRVCLEFNGQISEEYKEKLETIVDEILDAELRRSFLLPYINFVGQLLVKNTALKNLFDAYYFF